MFRSILKGSFLAGFLAASFCVIAISSNAHAKSSLSTSGDPALIETSAGQNYAAEKKSGATCPFAKKGNLTDSTTVADAGSAASSAGGFSSGRTTVH